MCEFRGTANKSPPFFSRIYKTCAMQQRKIMFDSKKHPLVQAYVVLAGIVTVIEIVRHLV